MARALDPLLRRDFRAGRITPYVISDYLVPDNSVKDSLNVNFDEIVGCAKVRYGTTQLGNVVVIEPTSAPFFDPLGFSEFVPSPNTSFGDELVTNGSFTGNANGWSLGSGWAYNVNNVVYITPGTGALSQDIGAIPGQNYRVEMTVGGTTGFVTVSLGGATVNLVAGSSGTAFKIPANESTLSITASLDFNGTIDDVSVEQIFDRILFVVYQGNTQATLYWFASGTVWHVTNLTDLDNMAKNRFATLGGSQFMTNDVDGMYSSPLGAVWFQGAANNCIDSADAKPSLVFRYKQRLLAAGDPNVPDRVYFSSIIDPTSSPFITWNTTDGTGDYIDVNPDDGGNITGFSENSTFCLVFKDTGMYRMDTISKTVDPDNIFDVGAVSQEAIILCMGVTYFFSGNGIYRTNGGYPEQISRAGVQDIINSMEPSQNDNVRAGTDGLNVYFEMGEITLNKNQSNERVILNLVLKYSPRDESWSVHGYRDYFAFFAQYTDLNGTLLRAATDAGNVQTLNLGKTDNSGSDGNEASIPFFLETQDQEMGNRAHQKGISNTIIVFTNNGLSSSFGARQDGGNIKPIKMELNKRVNVGKNVNLQGNSFNFYWSGTSKGDSPVLEGYYIEEITDNGLLEATGQSDILSPPVSLTS